MGQVPKPEIQRDKELIEDYLKTNESGGYVYSIAQLGVRYARHTETGEIMPLTNTRIHQILKKHSVEKKRIAKKSLKS